MRKVILCTLLLMCSCLLPACSGRVISLNDKDVKVNTLLIKKKGSIQTAIVEKFGKGYYNKKELEKFMKEEVAEYNKKAGEESVVIDSSKVENNTVVVTFTYASLKDYCSLNGVEAEQYTLTEAQEKGILPDKFTSAKDASKVKKSDVLETDKNYKVLILNEEYDVIVEGAIKYFSGAQLLNNTTVQTKSEEKSVIIYK